MYAIRSYYESCTHYNQTLPGADIANAEEAKTETIDHVKKLVDTMSREQRVKIWEHILLVLEKSIKYLNYGYKYIDIGENKMIKISYEESYNFV